MHNSHLSYAAIRGSSVVFFMDVLDSSLEGFYDQYMFIVQGEY